MMFQQALIEQALIEQALTPKQMIDSFSQFTDKIQVLLELLEIDLTPYEADHVALRINDYHLAELAHQAWLEQEKATQWSNNKINGRPIVTLGFHQPLVFNSWSIESLEFPYPGEKQYPRQGWEHIEWVIPCPASSQEEFLDYVCRLFPSLKQKWSQFSSMGINVKQSCPSGEGEALANYTIAFKYDGVCIKLHPHSLKRVIGRES